jgi:sigma-B regulation protein RsbU (phosphoserine phosphatase)
MFLKPTSLRQRTALYVLAPVCVLLLIVEIVSFRSIREMLIGQMLDSATSHLQRTATYIDSRLRFPKNLLDRLDNAPSQEIHDYLLDILTHLDGIVEVKLRPEKNYISPGREASPRQSENETNISYSALLNKKTISLTVQEQNPDGQIRFQFEVIISFYDLIGHIPGAPWWTGLKTFMIDEQGNILSPASDMIDKPEGAFEGIASLTQETRAKLLEGIRTNKSGTLASNDSRMPDTIYGFYRLTEAPWAIVVSSQGETALRPLITFRRSYFLFSILATGIILFLLNLLVTTRIIRTVKKLSGAATRLAEGHFDAPLELESHDELGELVHCFNTMSSQLQQGVQLKKAMAIAGEVQRGLLPQSQFSGDRLEAFGISIPCDETGGDFFDIVNVDTEDPQLTIVVGDVVGHGIGAALLMATTRALLRSRIGQAGDLSACLSDVNALLCRDTEPTGNFVTVFIMAIDKISKTISWIRAGHEPAMLYNLRKKEFSDLRGSGLALGIDPTLQYRQNRLEIPDGPHLILIGTDGVTDAENDQGERFSRSRLQSFVGNHSSQSPEDILQSLRLEIEAFMGRQHQFDDITMVIVKIS